ncbi:MAG: maleylacetoacetate isomerase [Neisseria sp.]|nr:maleylacetoacetate isomerase [Neisseria sp.]
MKLYSYFRSSAAYRVRIALNLKQLPYETVGVHLLRQGGEHKTAAYAAINPQQLVPSLQVDEQVFTQSLAILEYLEEQYPQVPLLPSAVAERARVRAIAQLIACDTHPLNNLRVLNQLHKQFGADEAQKNEWYQHWIHENFAALEKLLAQQPSRFCHGDSPSIADCCLVPQVYNARRFQCDLSAYPNIVRIDAECQKIPAFQAAAPEQQADAA